MIQNVSIKIELSRIIPAKAYLIQANIRNCYTGVINYGTIKCEYSTAKSISVVTFLSAKEILNEQQLIQQITQTCHSIIRI